MVVALAVCVEVALAGGYRIEVDVKGSAPDGDYNLAYYLGSKQYVAATGHADDDGVVVFEGDQALEPGIYLVTVPPHNQYVELLVAADQMFSVSVDPADLVVSARVKGAKETEAFLHLVQFQAQQRARVQDIRAAAADAAEGSPEAAKRDVELGAIDAEFRAEQDRVVARFPGALVSSLFLAVREPEVPADLVDEIARFEWYRAHFFDTFDFSEPGLVRTPILEAKVVQYVDKLTVQTPEALSAAVSELLGRARAHPEVFKFVAATLVNKYAQSKVMCQDAVYVHLIDEVYRTGQAVWADAEAVAKLVATADRIRPTLCGAQAPPLALRDATGQVRSLADVRAPVTVVYFYDPMCGHCKEGGPKVAKVLAAHPEVGVFTVSHDPASRWQEALAAWGFDRGIHVVRDAAPSSAYQAWDIRTTPRVFVVDADRRIVGKYIDADALEMLLVHELDTASAP